MTDLLLKLLTSAFIFSSFSLLQSRESKPCSKLCNASSASLSLFSRSMRTFTSAWGREWALLKNSLCLNNHPANSQGLWGTHQAEENERTTVRKTNRNIVQQHKSRSSCRQTEPEFEEVQIILVILLYSGFHFHSFPLIVWTMWNQRWYFNTWICAYASTCTEQEQEDIFPGETDLR